MKRKPAGHDNQIRFPGHLLDVPPTELEAALRQMMSRRAAMARATAVDPAGAAIRRARRIQRRRALTGSGLALVTIAIVGVGILQLLDNLPPGGATVVIGDPDHRPLVDRAVPSSGPETGPALAEVDLLIGGSIATAQGRWVPLLGTGEVERVHRLADGGGWLAVGAPTVAGRFLWVVAADGTTQVLLAGADEIVLDGEGRQVAWKQGTVLAAAGIVDGELADTVEAEAPAEAVPLRFVDGAVLVRLAPDHPGHVLWSLRPGPLEQGVDRASTQIFGALPDGRLVGQITPGAGLPACLTLLDPDQALAPSRPDCGPELPGSGRGAVSPDGRWLLVNGHSEGEDSALLVDLTTLDPSTEVRPAGPPMSGTVVWRAPDTAYYTDVTGGLVRVAVDRVTAGGPATPTALPDVPAGESPVVVSGG
ncbi:hypothetical protein HCA58_20890 [Micromonospora sp. HNM0581]|uniref:hypothetical protein n=1 Tax=Micromonospora sp. HNM0581 TaxID=2716341 RepID=UPI00146F69F6|nr:hypothetical protein [Micromonospora sp. HNM0581]NLU80773.1 hypothetical protein [Micromonospora sp. HNM0581]